MSQLSLTNRFCISFFCFLPFLLNSQTDQETIKFFIEATQQNNYKTIIEKGEKLLLNIDKNNLKIDSNVIKIRLWTALGYYKLGDYKKSLDLNLKN